MINRYLSSGLSFMTVLLNIFSYKVGSKVIKNLNKMPISLSCVAMPLYK